MELLFSFQAMERNGDVVAEINNCSSPNSSLISKRFNIGAYKMCKDDISSPLFCSASNCLRKSIMMGSKEKTDGTFLSADDKLFYNAQRTDECKLPAIEKSINSSANSFHSPLSSPGWENPPKLQSFSDIGTEKSCIQDSFLNGSKLQLSSSNLSVKDNNSVSKVKGPEVNLFCTETIDDKLLLDYEAETSSSSIEEVYYSMESQKSKILSSPEENDQPSKKCKLSDEFYTPREIIAREENKNGSPTTFEVDSNHNVKINSNVDSKENKNPLDFSSFFSPGLSEKEPEEKRDSNSEVKKERIMPELSPPLICLDDEDSLVPEISKKCEVIDVADSPEMPILIPFTSEVDEAIRIKTEVLSDSEEKENKNSDSDSADAIRQPQVCLQRMMLNHSSPEKRLSISSVSMAMYGNGMSNGPEIEEIEGVRFFQFRSKQEMEEFYRKTGKSEIDDDMIVPTKTMDITQIKGWRTKYFAPESQFQNQPCRIDTVKGDDSSADNKNSADHVDGDQNNSGDKKENNPPDSESQNIKTPNDESGNSGKGSQKNSPLKTDGNEEKILIKNIKEEKEDIKNPMSAFVSEELDKYLKNSSKLNVGELEKINPNILPISPNASILSIGKLRKDDRKFSAIQVFKRRREIYGEDYVIPITLNDSPGSPSVITLGSSEDSSCEEDIPVAKLRSKGRTGRRRNLGNKALKRKNSDSDVDQSGKRLVLRLTKEGGGGVSKGYKVSDISCEKEEPEEEIAPPSPSSMYDICKTVKMPEDGSLPVIKKTLFSQDNEPHLLEEFLNNLNMYGTRKDVAMLVQSNQSYFDGGPAINSKKCSKAISVLLTNTSFLEMKQKSKKKKIKTWQKYLPKKLSNKQKLKLSKKRKTRVQKLLEDAGDMIQTVKEKRSIRLPARYLDSAVLAASEWVSPVITIDDESPAKKCKRLSVESADKNKNVEENVPKSTEPLNRAVVTSSSSSASSSSSSASSSSSSSSEEEEESTPTEKSTKQAPPKKLNSANTSEKKKVDSPPTIKSTPKDKKSPANLKQTSVPGVSVTNKKGSTKSSTPTPTAPASAPKKYALPSCFCKQSSRTSVYDYISKELYCLFCYEVQQRLIADASVSFSEDTEAHVNRGLESSSKSDPVFKGNQISVNKNAEPVLNNLEDSISVKTEEDSTKLLPPVKSTENESKFMKVSPPSLPLTNTNSNSVQLSKQDKSSEDISSSSNVSPSNSNSKYILLLPPVKTAAGGTAIFGAPSAASTQKLPAPTAADPSKVNKKFKPPILIRKTPTGLVSPHTSTESTSPSPVNSATGLKNTIKFRYPVNTQNVVSNIVNNPSQSAALRLAKIAENASGASQQITISSIVSSSVSKRNAQQNATLVNSSLPGSKLVTAYRVGDSYYLCSNSSLPSKESSAIASQVARPAFFQAQHTNGPIISSVQSVVQSPTKGEDAELETLPNGLNKMAVFSPPKKSDVSPTISPKDPHQSALDDHFYHRKRPPKKRRKSPLVPKSCENEINVSDSGDEEVDIDTVDANFVAFKEVAKKDAESDSEVSDNECADIFISSTDQLASQYSKKSITEKKRRLLIKSGFENLKASSKHFKNAKTVIDILNMAQFVIAQLKKKDKINTLAKERLRIHNSMLLERLTNLLEGITPRKVRDNTKLQIINALAIRQGREDKKGKDKKSLSICAKEWDVSSKSERDKSGSEAPVIEIANCLPEEPVAKSLPDESGLNSEMPEEPIENVEAPELLKPQMLASQSSIPKGSSRFQEMKKKVQESLGKKENRMELNSLEETDDSSKSDDDSVQIFEDKTSPSKSRSQEIDLSTPDKEKTEEYPGLIPLFHPKVFKENFSSSSAPIYSQNSEGSSQPLGKGNFRMSLPSKAAADDDVSIIGSKIASPISVNVHMTDSSCSPTKTDCELSRAAEKANQLFGPCVVQKVQLKSGKTVFAYKTDAFGASQSGGGAKSRRSSSTSESSFNQNQSSRAPEEIVILDSDDETDNGSRTNQSDAPVDLSRSAPPHNFNVDVATDEDSDSDNLHIDESCTVDNSTL